MSAALIQRCLIAMLSGLCLTPAWADGTITHLSGKISVQKADGTLLPAAVGTKVGESDTMITGTNAYARLEMTDGGEMVLRPNSRLKVESYRFNADKPAEDKFSFSMLKGGLRTVTGLIGKRGDKDAYEGKTATATVGIRGTQYDMRLCQGDCGALADGTYFAVRFGAVRTGNAQGSMDVAAGQVVLVQQSKPPVLLPRDPGIGFTPPATIPKLDEKKKQSAAATSDAAPEQGKPASDSQESQQQGKQGDKQEEKQEDKQEEKQDKQDKQEEKQQQDKKQDSGSESGEKPESSESPGSKSKPEEGASAPANTSGDATPVAGTATQEGAAPDQAGKPGSASGSRSSASSSSPAGSAGGGGESPTSQAAQGVTCSIQ